MLNDLKSTFTRALPTVAQDTAGAAALVVMLIVGLHLPVLA